MGRARVIAVALLLALVVPLLSLPAAHAATPEVVLSLGDSVPSGARCDCAPYPVLYARGVASHTSRPVQLVDRAVSGATSASVLRQVEAWGTGAPTRSAGLVLVMVGANDFSAPFRRVLHHRQRAVRAFRPAAAGVRARTTLLVRRLRAQHPGVRVLVLGYWNVVRDGKVGRRSYGAWGVRRARQATTWCNDALRAAATATGAGYLSTLPALEGAEGHGDPTRLLAADGDHPNAAGHAAIARALLRVVPNG